MMNTNTQAILLLTAHFSRSAKDSVKPLSPTEWGRFAQWLNEEGKTPADLLIGETRFPLQGWNDRAVPLERIEQLLNRGHSLALALEKWSRAGIWVLTRSDADYPRALKHRLRNDAPPVLFGCGNVQLLNCMGVSVVGSRSAAQADLDYAHELGRRIVEAGYTVVSGGAKGIDETAMLAGLSNNGPVVGIMADGLLAAATAAKWRQGLVDDNLVLVSPFHPEAGFNTGNAMARNKYIYCVGQAAVVVHSGMSGGTWTGALENIKKAWVPLWVKPTADANAGNSTLVSRGAHWLLSDTDKLHVPSLIANEAGAASPASSISVQEERPTVEYAIQDEQGFYELFLRKMQQFDNAVTIEEMMTKWHLPKSLLNEWVKQSIQEGRVKKLEKPVRYQFVEQGQMGLQLG
ncbi:DNA-processing protein DprA [Pseudomonas sp. zfem002]|uniref:DNA-processing protein DprA n=1 Tax=Pseudomonas sp. zfem002 TaxID=3078197 RepID=UPI0029283809|nr:DNA-processing protein DprA [Pseudomonas sp. zfem002]MDU9389926.1 DNA-processing protein DprA [Pseudomonas sp. zfem002]